MLRLLRIHYGDTTLAPARRALDAYFAGDLAAIDDIQVATGGTPFQRTVWAALRRIPAGTTTSYGALAAIIGRPSAMRAVGLAVGSNPVAVIMPCHRVIGADHSLTGYGGGSRASAGCSNMKASSSAAAAWQRSAPVRNVAGTSGRCCTEAPD